MKSPIADLAPTLPLAAVRMEVVLANLLEEGYLTPEDLAFHPRGLFARGYNSDILEASWNRKEAKLELQVCREGGYDVLPKGLFHPPKTTPTSGLAEDKVATAEQALREEADARRFFLPFEQEFFRQRIALERKERQLVSGFSNPIHHLLFVQFFGELDFLTPYQREILFYLFPLFPQITGNMELTAQSFSSLLGVPVRIIPRSDGAVSFEPESAVRLSNVQVGLDWVLGGEVAFEDPLQVTLVIGPVAARALESYLPGGNQAKLIDCLSGYLLPIEMEYTVEILPEPTVSLFTLSDSPQTARLGYSTVVPSNMCRLNPD